MCYCILRIHSVYSTDPNTSLTAVTCDIILCKYTPKKCLASYNIDAYIYLAVIAISVEGYTYIERDICILYRYLCTGMNEDI